MSNELYAQLEAWWPVIGLTLFLAIILYVMRPGAKAKAEYRRDAEISFDDEKGGKNGKNGKDDRNGK